MPQRRTTAKQSEQYPVSQRFTCGVVSAGFLLTILRKFCRNSGANLRKFYKKSLYCVRKERGNSAGSSWKVRRNLRNDAAPEQPHILSELPSISRFGVLDVSIPRLRVRYPLPVSRLFPPLRTLHCPLQPTNSGVVLHQIDGFLFLAQARVVGGLLVEGGTKEFTMPVKNLSVRSFSLGLRIRN